MAFKPILCMDFDGVINSYESGWLDDVCHLPDPPVRGAISFLEDATNFWKVCIYSSRSHHIGAPEAMKKWLIKYAMLEASEQGTDLDYVLNWINQIEFPTYKPPAKLSIDDRGMRFDGVFTDPEELLKIEPWYKV